MSATLSPAAARGIFVNLIEHQRDVEPVKRKGDCEAVTMYRCTACEELHEYRSDAEVCCAEEGERARMACPVCDSEAMDAYVAVDCCLWKDLEAPARWRLAQMVEGGMPMLEAIELVTGQKAKGPHEGA